MNEFDQLRERVRLLEEQVGELRAVSASANGPPWKRNLGLFADDPVFAEIVKLGARIRKTDRSAKPKQARNPKSRRSTISKVIHSAKRTG